MSREGCAHVKGVPMIVPLSLSFQPNPNINSTHPWEIVGTMNIVYPRHLTTIYEHTEKDPDKPTPDINGFLPLTRLYYDPIPNFFPDIPFRVNLFDVKSGKVLFKDKDFNLDYTDYDNYDRVDYKMVEGEYGTLRFKYITYRAASYARVNVAFKRKDGQEKFKELPVAGSITALFCYDTSDISLHSDHDKRECDCIPLLIQNEEVLLGTYMELFWHMVAVPAYSVLAIHVDVDVSEYGKISDVVFFPASDNKHCVEIIQGSSELFCEVDVKFSHEYDYHSEMEEIIDYSEPKDEKKVKVDLDAEVLSSSYIVFSDHIAGVSKAEKLMEVFSIRAFAKNCNEICNIHGKIEVTDPDNKNFYLYDKEEDNAEKIEGKGLLSLEGPHDHPLMLPFHIQVDLKAGDRSFCKGYFNWPAGYVRGVWLDSLLCSVIKGKHGYVAVHYIIYSVALQARVKLYLISSNHLRRFGSVIGKVTAEHDSVDYDTYFVRECYKNRVFSRTRESPALLSGDEESIPVPPKYVESGILPSDGGSRMPKLFKGSGIRIPLSKSVICAWEESSLVFDLNLSARFEMEGSQHGELAFSGRVECEMGRQTCVAFQNGDSQVCLLVD